MRGIMYLAPAAGLVWIFKLNAGGLWVYQGSRRVS
jgi:hypothetical protein